MDPSSIKNWNIYPIWRVRLQLLVSCDSRLRLHPSPFCLATIQIPDVHYPTKWKHRRNNIENSQRKYKNGCGSRKTDYFKKNLADIHNHFGTYQANHEVLLASLTEDSPCHTVNNRTKFISTSNLCKNCLLH